MSLIIYLKKLNIEGGHIDPKGKRGLRVRGGVRGKRGDKVLLASVEHELCS